jgi:demethylmenaquinone methyltransferase/2-methoxy-6-polyprenyl-1,4-benzoquinol methylase
MPDRSRTATTPLPVLGKYYSGEGDRQPFVTSLFDGAARHYDRVCDLGSLGSSRFYRGWVLRQSGLRPGMTLLDVATGTGLVARAAVRVVKDPKAVIGLDPSAGMLAEARRTLDVPLAQGQAEALPFGENRFDVVTMAYALRHVADLEVTFGEFLRVLRPGGRLLLLEISRPRAAVVRWALRVHLQHVLPLVVRLSSRGARVGVLMQYYWDTIAHCVPPETILDVLSGSGFVDVRRGLRFGLLSEYRATKPRPPSTAADHHSADGQRGGVHSAQPVAAEHAQQSPTVR